MKTFLKILAALVLISVWILLCTRILAHSQTLNHGRNGRITIKQLPEIIPSDPVKGDKKSHRDFEVLMKEMRTRLYGISVQYDWAITVRLVCTTNHNKDQVLVSGEMGKARFTILHPFDIPKTAQESEKKAKGIAEAILNVEKQLTLPWLHRSPPVDTATTQSTAQASRAALFHFYLQDSN